MGINRRIRRQEQRKVKKEMTEVQYQFLNELKNMSEEERNEYVNRIKEEYQKQLEECVIVEKTE